MLLPWKERSTSALARQSEKQAVKKSGGRRSPMSGAGRVKGDIQTVLWLIEDKITDARSFRVELGMTAKTIREAVEARRLPQWRFTIAGQTFRMFREDDILPFIDEAQK